MALVKEAATMELIWNIIRGRTDGISKVTFFPQKPAFPEEVPYEQPFERDTPESQGISSARIAQMLHALGEERTLHLHSVMILKNGRVIGETGFYPYQKELWHATYSMAKSVVSMAIGFLIQEEKIALNTKIVDIFKKNVNLIGMLKLKGLTVEHLLTMTSGSSFNETGAVSGNDWVKSFLEAGLHHDAGEIFEYNSMNTYMLSAIVTEVTGEKLADYLKPRLFEPLGITRVFWESCPKGITKGGWGLFLCIEDMAKLGQLYLQKGMWKGKQIISSEWVEQSTDKKSNPPEDTGFTGYGYQIWRGKRKDSFTFNGMMGQNVFVYPDVQMVVVTTAGNEEFFTSNAMQNILERYLPEQGEQRERLPENMQEYQKLREVEWNFSHPRIDQKRIKRGGWHRKKETHTEWYEKAKALNGKQYELSAVYIGLFPLMGQVFHNNYTEGIRALRFELEERNFSVSFLEGEEEKTIPLGMEEAKVTDLDLHGEKYRIAAEGSFHTDEDGMEVLKIVLSYLEDATKRIIKLFFKGERIELRASEVPGKAIILDGLSSVAGGVMDNPIVKKIREKGSVDVIHLLMESAIEPKTGGREKTEDTEEGEQENLAEPKEPENSKIPQHDRRNVEKGKK